MVHWHRESRRGEFFLLLCGRRKKKKKSTTFSIFLSCGTLLLIIFASLVDARRSWRGGGRALDTLGTTFSFPSSRFIFLALEKTEESGSGAEAPSPKQMATLFFALPKKQPSRSIFSFPCAFNSTAASHDGAFSLLLLAYFALANVIQLFPFFFGAESFPFLVRGDL